MLNKLAWGSPIKEWARKSVIDIPNQPGLTNLIIDICDFAEVKWNQVLLLQKFFKLLVVLDDKVASPFQVMDEGTFTVDVRVTVSIVQEVGTVFRSAEAAL